MQEITVEIKNEIKAAIVSRGLSFEEVANRIEKEFNLQITSRAIRDRLNRGTLQVQLAKMIAKVIDYEITWKKLEIKER